MSLLSAILLAVLQGLTEFLPVSSSGHLVLAGMVLEVPEGDIGFEVIVHLGTLIAVIAVYSRDLIQLLGGCLRREKSSLRMLGLLALASVPAGLAGVILGGTVERAFGNPVLVSLMLLVTGCILYMTRYAGSLTKTAPGWRGSLLIGTAQAFALLPGISRSGATISCALFGGIRQKEAARFSFLLSVPAIMGAGLLKLGEIGDFIDPGIALTGLIVSAVVGFFALKLLLRFLCSGKFANFAWYCWSIGSAGLVYSILRG